MRHHFPFNAAPEDGQVLISDGLQYRAHLTQGKHSFVLPQHCSPSARAKGLLQKQGRSINAGGTRLEVQVIPQCSTKSQLWASLSSESQGKLKSEASGDLLLSNLGALIEAVG